MTLKIVISVNLAVAGVGNPDMALESVGKPNVGVNKKDRKVLVSLFSGWKGPLLT